MSLRRFVLAVVLSGLPSTLHAIATGRDPLQATKAAASLIPVSVAKQTADSARLTGTLARGAIVHVAVSAWWAFVLSRLRVRGVLGGAVAGSLIAALDLEVIGRRCPELRALPRVPQWLDHVAFGVLVVPRAAAVGTVRQQDGGEARRRPCSAGRSRWGRTSLRVPGR